MVDLVEIGKLKDQINFVVSERLKSKHLKYLDESGIDQDFVINECNPNTLVYLGDISKKELIEAHKHPIIVCETAEAITNPQIFDQLFTITDDFGDKHQLDVDLITSYLRLSIAISAEYTYYNFDKKDITSVLDEYKSHPFFMDKNNPFIFTSLYNCIKKNPEISEYLSDTGFDLPLDIKRVMSQPLNEETLMRLRQNFINLNSTGMLQMRPIINIITKFINTFGLVNTRLDNITGGNIS